MALEPIGHYMGSGPQQQQRMPRRALLTDREIDVLTGDLDAGEVEDIEAYRQKIQSRVRGRADKLERDLDVLDEVAPEIADEIRETVCGEPVGRLERLEKEVEALRDERE